MTKLDMQSPDLTEANIEKLAELFPNCVTEAQDENGKLKRVIDFDQFKQELSDHVVDVPRERYQLNWPGKREALLAANAPIAKTLRPCREESVDFDTTNNLFIEGDNLDALKLLQETYLNKVKMIYIDPPYNTGNDFIYKDDYSELEGDFLRRSEQKDQSGNRLVINTDSNGRFHSDWLSMMYPRLKLARNLLRDDGLIFISIDDNEYSNLKSICDEIFGASNGLISFIWPLPRGINAGHISRAHEYLIVYAKQKSILPLFNKLGSSEFTIDRCNKKVDRRHPASEITFPPGIKYEGPDKTISGKISGSEEIEINGSLEFKNGKLVKKVTLKAGWTMKNMILDWLDGKTVYDNKGQEIIEFFFKENGKLYSKKRLKYESPKTILQNVPDTQYARKEIEELLGSQDIFSYPKPSGLIKRLIELSTNQNDIILDFFAGSCSTAQAKYEINREKGINNQFILVQIPEELDSTDITHKAAIEFCQSNNLPENIAEIGKERIRRAGKKVFGEKCNESWNKDIGFRVFKIDTSNMKDVYYTPDSIGQEGLFGQVDNIKDDRSNEDLLFQVLLDWGIDLTLPIKSEKIANRVVYFVDEDALAACFEPGIDEEFVKILAERKPLRAVFRDSAYGSDSAKLNVEQIFKLISPVTEVKTI